MAKTKIEVELEKKVIDWKRVEVLLENYSAYKKYWNKYKNDTLRNLLIKNLHNLLYDSDKKLMTELKDKKYKKSLQEYYVESGKKLKERNWYTSASNHEEQIELINFHKIDVTILELKSLYSAVDEGGVDIYMSPKTLKELKKEILTDISNVNIGNLHLVKDKLSKDDILTLSKRHAIYKSRRCCSDNFKIYDEFIELFKENLSLKELIETEKSFNSELVSIFGVDILLEELLKTEKPVDISTYDYKIKKVDLTEEQTKTLLKHQKTETIRSFFNLFPVPETFVYDICHLEDPSIHSDKINEIILRKDFDALKKDNYEFRTFKKINLTTETAKILFDEGKLKFNHYKNYATKEDIDNIIKEKEQEILNLLNHKEVKVEDKRGEYPNEYGDRGFGSRRDTTTYKIIDIVHDYDISLDFIIRALCTDEKEMDRHYKSMITHMLLDSRMGRRGMMMGGFCGW